MTFPRVFQCPNQFYMLGKFGEQFQLGPDRTSQFGKCPFYMTFVGKEKRHFNHACGSYPSSINLRPKDNFLSVFSMRIGGFCNNVARTPDPNPLFPTAPVLIPQSQNILNEEGQISMFQKWTEKVCIKFSKLNCIPPT